MSYTHEANAQFAKEAMQCQSMDMDEILNVRWVPYGTKSTDAL